MTLARQEATLPACLTGASRCYSFTLQKRAFATTK
ncbi:protein of unknown function [Methylorubrum extorquens]|uniref:Uncharacterized protein n=1 Tax=Methylorubrum extorquens TaxID=408 RepID=A0A2N9AM64_METEX|nr:protein of unknown function [Methylorubrum extorquens]